MLELLVVIGLLGLVAMTATTLIVDNGEEKRKDATEKNWDAIRKAIIGDSTLTLNGSPYLGGYVVDMGRLPSNLAELITRTPDVDLDGDGAPDLNLPEQPDWQEIDLNTVDGASGTGVSGSLYGGWRGPYLYTAGSQRFADGWLNESISGSGVANETQFFPDALAIPVANRVNNKGLILVEDALNFGWNVSHSPTLTASGTQYQCGELFCEHLVVQSLGQGGLLGDIANPNDTLDYSANFPKVSGTNIVNKNEWMVNNAVSFDVVFNKPCTTPPTCPTNLLLRIFNFEDDGIEDVSPTNTPQDSVNVIEVGLSLTTTAIDSMGTGSVSNTDLPLPIGRYAAIVACNNSPAVDYLYDGNCDSTITRSQPYYFLVMSGSTKVTIPWNIP